MGEVAGHWIRDLSGTAYARAYNGRLEPEARLIPIYFATPIMVLGIVHLAIGLDL